MKSLEVVSETTGFWQSILHTEWRILPLKFFGNIVLGKMLTPENKGEFEEKPYLRAKNIGWETVQADDINTMWFSHQELEQLRLRNNDLLICEGGEVGRTAIWCCELDECYIQNSINKVTIREDYVPRFFLYQSELLGKTGYYDSIVNRVSIAHLTRDKLKDVRFLVPPASEQQAITDFLDRKTAQIDTLIAKKQRQIELLQEQRTAIINQAVTKGLNPSVPLKDSGVEFLGEIPTRWNVVTLRHLLKDGNEGIKIGPFGSSLKLDVIKSEGYKVYGQGNVINNDFSWGTRFIDEQKFSEMKVYELFSGDIVITMMGTTGKAKVVPDQMEKGIIDSHLIRIRTNAKAISEYVASLINDSDYIFHQIKTNSKGSIMEGLNSSIIKSLVIALPSTIEQRVILDYIDEETCNIDSLVQCIKKQINLLVEYRTALISEAVTGKIDVRGEA